MQAADGDWKDSRHLRDSVADDVTVPETPGLQLPESTTNLEYHERVSDCELPVQTSRLNHTDYHHPDDDREHQTNNSPVATSPSRRPLNCAATTAPTSNQEGAHPLPTPQEGQEGLFASGPAKSGREGDAWDRQPSTFASSTGACGESGNEADKRHMKHSDAPACEKAPTSTDSPEATSTDSPEVKDGAHSESKPQATEPKRPFDCNVCFDLANDPVVTRCGHLYCWPCLHAWLEQARECPVCKAQVTKETVVPIYGQGQDAIDPRSKAQAEGNIPSRPRPERVEAARRRPQQNQQAPWNLSMFAGSTLSFGIFPIGVGVTWPGTWFTNQGAPPFASNEEIFSQLLSLAFLFVAIFVTLGIVFVGDHSPEF